MNGAASEVRLGHFLQQFPLRGYGRYHFRFRVPDKLSGYLWMDLSDPSAVLPLNNNRIYAKVLRLDRLPKPRPSRLRRKTPHVVTAGAAERNVGTTSWRREQQAQRRMDQEQSDSRRGQWQGPEQTRPRSASPAHQHHISSDIPTDLHKGKSSTPPSNRGVSKGPLPRGPPPVPPRPQNFESFLYSDAPTGPPNSNVGSQVRSNGDFQKGETPVARSSSGGATASGEDRSRGGFERKRAGSGARGSKSGDDLLNFGNDPHGAGASAGVAGAAAAAGGRSSGRSSPPPGWGPHPGRGAASPTTQTTDGRMQGRPVRPGAPSNGGGMGSGGSASGGGVPGGSSNGGGRQTNFGGAPGSSGGSAGEPDLMNVNAGGSTGGGARAEGGDRSSYVQSKVAEREREVERATKKAVQFKKDMDEAAAKDQEDLDAAKQKYDAMLTAWAEDHGKKRNIRTLLSTMHTVLWEGNRWKPVTMADLIQPSKVKVAYRKSMLLVHPDKCGSLGPEERLIARRVFEAVNEAYTIFAEKEMS